MKITIKLLFAAILFLQGCTAIAYTTGSIIDSSNHLFDPIKLSRVEQGDYIKITTKTKSEYTGNVDTINLDENYIIIEFRNNTQQFKFDNIQEIGLYSNSVRKKFLTMGIMVDALLILLIVKGGGLPCCF